MKRTLSFAIVAFAAFALASTATEAAAPTNLAASWTAPKIAAACGITKPQAIAWPICQMASAAQPPQNNEKAKDLGRRIVNRGAELLFGAIGSTIGSALGFIFGGPVGAVIGGTGGGIVGSVIGGWLTGPTMNPPGPPQNPPPKTSDKH